MPSTAATLILEFGKLIHHETKRQDPDPRRVECAEQRLIEQLSIDPNPHLKPALLFHVSKSIDPLQLRILSLVSYLQLCTQYCTAITDIAIDVGDNEPPKILVARQVIAQLLFVKRLILRVNSDEILELGQPMMTLLAGGNTKLPLVIGQYELHSQWRKNDAAAAKRKAQEAVVTLPSAKQLAAKIAEHVIGLDSEVRTFACRLALHTRRAAMLRAGQDPGSPNEVLLFLGPSGCGKTWLAETAGRVCGLPFGAISSTDLTCDGYQGLNVDDAVRQVFEAARHDIEQARYAICFFDEWDKKRASGTDFGSRDVAGASVQQAVLKLVEGTEYQIGGRRGGFELQCSVNTQGMFFVFAGAFIGLDKLLSKKSAHGMGFGGQPTASSQQYLYDGLIEFGLIPEFCNRLTAVLTFPSPTVDQLTEIATRAVIPSYAKLLASTGANLQISPDGIHLMAEAARDTGTYARGIKSVVARLIEDCVFEERKGLVQLGAAEVTLAIEAAGLAAVPSKHDHDTPPEVRAIAVARAQCPSVQRLA